jgi:hypothetical protein
MEPYRIEAAGLSLEVVARGVRDQLQPSEADLAALRLATPESLGELTKREARDLEAFQRARWRFRAVQDVQAANQEQSNDDTPGQSFLLARHPAKRLVVLESCILLKLDRSANIPQLRRRYRELKKLDFGEGLYEAYVRLEGSSLQEALQRELDAAKATKGVVFVEPSIFYHFDRQPTEEKLAMAFPAEAQAVEPSEETALGQWHWDQIDLFDAWATEGASRGNGKRVGVIDLGFGPDDQMGKVAWGAVIDLQGKAEPCPQANLPLNDHGVSCAALVAAPVDGVAVHGAAPESELILIALDTGKIVGAKILGKAITLCALGGQEWGEGADVISCSLGLSDASWGNSQVVHEAINVAVTKGRNLRGTPVVWALFNRERLIPRNAVEAYEPLISVSASDRDDQLHNSGFGKGLDLLAPGQSLSVLGWSAANGRRLASKTGSSMAAPCVAGVVALVLAAADSLTAQQVEKIIQRTCDRRDGIAGWRQRRGWGRLNARRAVEVAVQVRNGADLDQLLASLQAPHLPLPPPPEPPGLHG